MFLRTIASIILSSPNISLDIKQECTISPTQFQIFSERCSGSNFVFSLIEKNLALTPGNFGHKHYTPWLSLPIDSFTGPDRHYTFENNENTLFIILFRNPFDWIRSFYLSPHHAAPELLNLSFSKFIRSPWKINPIQNTPIHFLSIYPYFELDPTTLLPFPNPLKLRSAKIRNMLMIKMKVSNCCVVQYEKVKKYPQAFIDELAKRFNISKIEPFTPIVEYKGNPQLGTYKEKKYAPISKEDSDFILEQLDTALEKSIGYPLPKVK